MQKATYVVQTPAQHKAICIRHLVWASLDISRDGAFTISLVTYSSSCLTSYTENHCFLVSHLSFACYNLCLLPKGCFSALLRSVLQTLCA